MPVLHRSGFESWRFAANHFRGDGAARNDFRPAAAQIFVVANHAGDLSAGLAFVCKHGCWSCAAKKRNTGIAAEKTPRVGKGVWTSAEKNIERAALAGFGFDCVRNGDAKFTGIDFAASACAFATVCASTV